MDEIFKNYNLLQNNFNQFQFLNKESIFQSKLFWLLFFLIVIIISVFACISVFLFIDDEDNDNNNNDKSFTFFCIIGFCFFFVYLDVFTWNKFLF